MSFAVDYLAGKKAECECYKYLAKFSKSILIHNENPMARWDYESEDCLIELKSRNVASTDYPTAMLQYKKIMNANLDNSGKRILYAFKYTDGLFVIEYDPVEFSGYEIITSKVNDRIDYKEKMEPRIYIPIADLCCVKKYPVIKLRIMV